MSNEYNEEDIIYLQDEDGSDIPCRFLDRLTVRGVDYAVICELEDEDSVMIFRITDNGDGSENYDFVEDEDENEEVFDYFRIAFEDYDFCDAE